MVVIGPESTGKRTLCAALAAALDTVWIDEYAREYLTGLQHEFSQADLLRIAEGQLELERAAIDRANRLLICDTNLHVIRVWSENKYGNTDLPILQYIAESNYDLYLLTDIDIPWEPDTLREHPEPEMRAYFYRQYKDTVINSGIPWVNILGNPEQRLETALNAIKKHLNISHATTHSP